MKRIWWLLPVFAAGCIQTEDEFVLNPDGSGKVQHTAVFQPFELNSKATDPAAAMTDAITKELSEAQGVDAWKDIRYERTAEGHIRFPRRPISAI